MFYDSHTHLNSNQLFPDRKKHLEDFCKIGWKWLINIGVDHIYNDRAIQIAEQWTQQETYFVKAAIGFHPCIVDEQSLQKSHIPTLISDLKSQISNDRNHIVAIWEIGVDLYRWESKETKLIQQELFDRQCHLANELQLPIVIHSRAAFDETIEVVNHHPTLDIYFHCRGYGPTQLDKLSTFFWHCWTGFCGNVSYPKAQELRDSLHHLVNNYWWWSFWQLTTDNWQSEIRLLLETDAPYLAMQLQRWQTQTPEKIGLLYEYVSELLQVEQKTLQVGLEENFRSLYQTK
jgi:TatD DNase family protein